jgi:uncharacterized membrane protein YjgN (DUF898 family)
VSELDGDVGREVDGGSSAFVGQFRGRRTTLFVLLARGLLLLVPTIGIYRFWLLTQKRRFLWSETFFGGEPLEYTGTAREILFGFLFALAVFIPVYGVFAYLATQEEGVAGIGSVVLGVFLLLLTGFAAFRSRRFRLTRTLWRGIRFHQTGSAWKYAFMRFGWIIVVTLTAGLAFPFMAAHLFRYRFNHTWYGTQRLTSTASWRQIAGPFYLFWVLTIVAVLAYLGAIGVAVNDQAAAPVIMVVATVVLVAFLGLGYAIIASRERSRFISSIRIGATGIRLRLRARSLIGMYILFAFVVSATFLVIAVALGAATAGIIATVLPELAASSFEAFLQRLGPSTFFLVIGVYLAFLAVFALLSDLFMALSYWKLVAANIEFSNPGALNDIRADGEESPSFGEGLADAFGGGAY